MKPSSKGVIRLIHWNEAEGRARAKHLSEAGYDVAFSPLKDGRMRDLRANPPDAIVIDLTRQDLERRIASIARNVGPGGVWICWPKKTSALVCDIGQAEVRAAGLASGIVDYKVCAIDPIWSGLRFARRRSDKAKP